MNMAAASLEQAFAEHRAFLWRLAYRLTGDAADADDVVQDTFVRLATRPPRRLDEPLRPWLVRVATNLGRDLLRRRRRRGYDGPWLPSPAPSEVVIGDEPGPDARYGLRESASFAFLLALEALTPNQRAVTVLRDVLDYSVREAAQALGMGEDNVKTTHLRARRALATYDRARPAPAPAADVEAVLGRFLACLAAGDAPGVEALLAEDVVSLADGGGRYAAARGPLAGRAVVTRLYLGLTAKIGAAGTLVVRSLNGLPTAIGETPNAPAGWAPRFVLQCELDGRGRIRRLYSVVAPAKLTAV